MDEYVIKALADCIDQKKDMALVAITKAEGSSPRGIGSMMVVSSEGAVIAGSIGGGQVERKAIGEAVSFLKRGISGTVNYVLEKDSDSENKLDMTCGGNVELFISVFNRRDKLVIVGGGHIGLYLYNFAQILGYSVTIVDDRPEIANKERFPQAKEIIHGDVVSILKDYDIDEGTSIVIATHGHENDEQALEAVINSPARYIGMIGSLQKIRCCFDNLIKKGINENLLSEIYTPIGLNIGGERPEEIALAVISEVQAVKYGRCGGFLTNNDLLNQKRTGKH